MTNRLDWEVFVSAQIPAQINDLPPGAGEMKWSPISSTLIFGKQDAVLVDTAITVDQNQKIVDWITASGKNLTTIYATHGHGDHFFGVNTIRKQFPKARFVATREVISLMQIQASAQIVNAYWKPRFPGQIDSTLEIAEELKGGVIELEGEQLVSVPLGHTDTDGTTCLHVPSLGLVVAGDAAYNDVHLHLGESGGAMDIRQLLFRPTRSLYRTLQSNLYLCGASTPPGGGSTEWPVIIGDHSACAPKLIQRTPSEAPQRLCTSLDSMFTRRPSAFCVKDAAGRVHQEGKIGATRRDLDGWNPDHAAAPHDRHGSNDFHRLDL
jgi:glyoxylase-like metal-dependent hydrolase (beta-lactamase superfamily II)